MAVNIEIKARVRDMDALRARAEALSDTPCRELAQEDIFFQSPQGRLKLRILAEDEGQLIYYERSDVAGPRTFQRARPDRRLGPNERGAEGGLYRVRHDLARDGAGE